MLILISVVVGYLLGIAPYIIKNKKIREEEKQEEEHTEKEEREMIEKTNEEALKMFNEFLFGATENKKEKNQQELYNEYITGKEV